VIPGKYFAKSYFPGIYFPPQIGTVIPPEPEPTPIQGGSASSGGGGLGRTIRKKMPQPDILYNQIIQEDEEFMGVIAAFMQLRGQNNG